MVAFIRLPNLISLWSCSTESTHPWFTLPFDLTTPGRRRRASVDTLYLLQWPWMYSYGIRPQWVNNWSSSLMASGHSELIIDKAVSTVMPYFAYQWWFWITTHSKFCPGSDTYFSVHLTSWTTICYNSHDIWYIYLRKGWDLCSNSLTSR